MILQGSDFRFTTTIFCQLSCATKNYIRSREYEGICNFVTILVAKLWGFLFRLNAEKDLTKKNYISHNKLSPDVFTSTDIQKLWCNFWLVFISEMFIITGLSSEKLHVVYWMMSMSVNGWFQEMTEHVHNLGFFSNFSTYTRQFKDNFLTIAYR